MKKTILLIALAITSTISYGQSTFDKLEDMDGVMSVVISKDAFKILSKFNFESKNEGNEMTEVFKMIENLNEFKTFSTKIPEIATQMENMVKNAVKVQKLTELMRLKEDNSKVWIYVKTTSVSNYQSVILPRKSVKFQTSLVVHWKKLYTSWMSMSPKAGTSSFLKDL